MDKNGNNLNQTPFTRAEAFNDGVAIVSITNDGGGYNIINTKGEYLSDIWFDGIYSFYEGIARVSIRDVETTSRLGIPKLDYRYNYIDKNGRLISDVWFAWGGRFESGIAMVDLFNDDNSYLLGKDGKIYDTNGNVVKH